MATTKSGAYAVIFEIVFGLLLIGVGVVKPAFLWNLELIQSVVLRLGNTLTSLLLIVGGGLLIGWTIFKKVVMKK